MFIATGVVELANGIGSLQDRTTRTEALADRAEHASVIDFAGLEKKDGR